MKEMSETVYTRSINTVVICDVTPSSLVDMYQRLAEAAASNIWCKNANTVM
jgi:hypothetical protein